MSPARAARPPRAPTRPRAPRPRARARPPPAHQRPTVTSTQAAPLPSSAIALNTLFHVLTLFSHMLTLAPTRSHTPAPHTLILTRSFPTIRHSQAHGIASHLTPNADVYNHTCTHPNIHPHVPILDLRPHSRVPLGITVDTGAHPASLPRHPSLTVTLPPGSLGVTITHVRTRKPARSHSHTSSMNSGAHTCALSFRHSTTPIHIAHPQLLRPDPQPHSLAHTLSQCLRPTHFPRA